MSELGRGAGDLGRGLRFLNANPGLWGWVLAPALVTLLLLVGAIALVVRLAGSVVAAATGWLPDSVVGVASGVMWLVVGAGLALGAWLVFIAVMGIVAGPFCELLSEAIEARVTGTRGQPFSVAAFLRGAAMGLVHGLRRLLVSLVGLVLVFGVGLVPVAGTIAAVALGGWLAARSAAYDCYDAVLARRGLAYRDKLAYLAEHRGRTLGLGAGVVGLLLIPGVNLVALGVGVAGATLAVLEADGRGAGRASRGVTR